MTTDWDVAFYDTCMRKIAPAFIAPFLKECQLKGSDSLLKMEGNKTTSRPHLVGFLSFTPPPVLKYHC